MKTNMDTLKRLSPIEKIHLEGMRAVIDGDYQFIVSKVKPDDLDDKIRELEMDYPNVGEDANGDIIFYRD